MSAFNIWSEIAKNISGAMQHSYEAGVGMTDHLGTSQGTAGELKKMDPKAGAISPLTRAQEGGKLPGEGKPAGKKGGGKPSESVPNIDTGSLMQGDEAQAYDKFKGVDFGGF